MPRRDRAAVAGLAADEDDGIARRGFVHESHRLHGRAGMRDFESHGLGADRVLRGGELIAERARHRAFVGEEVGIVAEELLAQHIHGGVGQGHLRLRDVEARSFAAALVALEFPDLQLVVKVCENLRVDAGDILQRRGRLRCECLRDCGIHACGGGDFLCDRGSGLAEFVGGNFRELEPRAEHGIFFPCV